MIDLNWYMWVSLLFPFSFVLFGAGLVRSIKKTSTISEADFYYGRVERRGIFERRKLNLDNVASVMGACCAWVIIYLLCAVLVRMIPTLETFCEEESDMISQLPEFMCTIWLAMLGILVVLVTFSKKHWLTFDSRDIIKYFGIEKMMMCMLRENIAAWGIGILSLMLPAEVFGVGYYALRILILVIFGRFMFQFLKVSSIIVRCFLGNWIEGIFVDKLYQELQFHPIRRIDEEWKDDSVDEYLEYLCESLKLSSKKVNKRSCISKITYSSNVDKEGKGIQRKRYKRLGLRSAIIFLGAIGAWEIWVICSAIRVGITKTELIIGIVLLIVVVSWLFFWRREFAIFAIILAYGRAGYEISYKRRRKYVCLERGTKSSGKFKYVRDVKNLVTFGVLAIESKKEKTITHIIGRYQKESLECPDFFVPLIVLDYIYYIKNNGTFLLAEFPVQDRGGYINDFAQAFALDIERGIDMQGVKPDKFEDYRKARLQNKKKKVK